MSLRWHSHFLQLCIDHARMSKDPSTQVGAIIVGPDKEVRSAGFNGFPRGIEDTQYRLQTRDIKLKLMVHAEMNAILGAVRAGISIKDCTLYLAATQDNGEVWGGPPCSRCTVELIQSGIKHIVSWQQRAVPSRWHEDIKFAKELLDEVGIDYLEINAD